MSKTASLVLLEIANGFLKKTFSGTLVDRQRAPARVLPSEAGPLPLAATY
jgi:hypothetical protein